ncbi:MAG: ATP-binding cassette domain-containing protein [Chlorobiota bacterium]|nr:MAG: ATP-binding cassette domain-containing protein [Chlorobiota bacterium]
MIKAENLNKKFATVHAVKNVSISAQKGEIYGLIGPNGAGKSTTIRMITNIVQPDSGSITYNNEIFCDKIRDNIGYMPEERGLYQKSKILETIIHFAKLKGMDSNDAKTKSENWLKRFSIEKAETRRIEELSKGNQQKVQLIISLIHEPEYIILDEPASGLDPVNQELLREIINQLRDEGKTILYSTHQMELAEKLCNRIALINKGEIVIEGTIKEVKSKYGNKNILLEFEGDGKFISSLNGIEKADIYMNYAELTLKGNSNLNEIISQVYDKITISKIELVQPSLKTIFIETVGKQSLESN